MAGRGGSGGRGGSPAPEGLCPCGLGPGGLDGLRPSGFGGWAPARWAGFELGGFDGDSTRHPNGLGRIGLAGMVGSCEAAVPATPTSELPSVGASAAARRAARAPSPSVMLPLRLQSSVAATEPRFQTETLPRRLPGGPAGDLAAMEGGGTLGGGTLGGGTLGGATLGGGTLGGGTLGGSTFASDGGGPGKAGTCPSASPIGGGVGSAAGSPSGFRKPKSEPSSGAVGFLAGAPVAVLGLAFLPKGMTDWRRYLR